ncbi:MAG: hypothetical protein QME44_02430 [Thermodesulfobacteriota bacterium]|nr:hypothetical protein [Thermodesulfobacteriota bacterium]
MNTEPDWLDYFSGGVPTGEYFRITLSDLREVADLRDADEEWPGTNRFQQLCFIGAVCYFEAFCKDHFASILNIEPFLVANLKAAGQDTSVDAAHVVLYGHEIDHRIGFVLAEKYDFGAAAKINSAFNALLKVTPFNKDEAERYSEILRDRNLLVHHGGTFTLRYLEQKGAVADARANAFYQSRTVRAADVLQVLDFFGVVAQKLIRATHAALLQHLLSQGRTYSGQRQKALEATVWWENEAPA